ncbi:hypothetical protein Q4F19_07825 [Sphingomonas sp. BIUV-7]|uniref:Hemerythrin-like domain-containing protein n=1 Tax=Sphingomonas natans TaxID=3063330 RepID=A0ABT8Y7K5_9SPHN|nr:hypothetical protein [Sphingomonas sp. BIUV-7]MDO6414288.1 hypothetical protein [Sphingomonas sp. BIUV-7]
MRPIIIGSATPCHDRQDHPQSGLLGLRDDMQPLNYSKPSERKAMLRMLQEDQREILEMMDHSRRMFQQPEEVDALTVDRIRWRFDRVVARHIHSLRTEIGDWAAKFHPEESGRVSSVARLAEDLSHDYEYHKAKHPTRDIHIEPDVYIASASLLMGKLEHLLQEERAIVFPLLPDD